MMLSDVVLFEAMDTYDTTSLWVTNGTATGTFELTSSGGPPVKGQALITGEATYGFAPSPAVSLGLTVFNNQVLFAGRIGPGGIGPFELWTTNGTAAGTVALTPVAGASSAGLFTAAVTPGFTVFGNEVLFRGIDRSGASGLWTTDGSAAGTNEITGINGVAATGINPTDITVFNDKALFNGADAAGALGLWTTDGTASGTTEVAVNGAASAGVNPTDMTVFNGEVLFNGIDNGGASGLWVTDGTTAGTHELTGIAQAPTTGSGLNPSNMTVFEGRVFFTGTDASGLSGLWVTDGTAGGTQELVAEAAGGGGAKDPLGLNPSDLTVFNGEIFFSGFDQDGRRQLWKTDGTAGGAQMLAPAAESTVYGLKPSSLEVYDNQLLFSGLNSKGLQGLWTSDGTAAGTVEITPSSGTWAYGLNPVDLTALAPTPTTALTPTISGTVSGQTTTSEAPVKPFAHVTIGDANVGATDTLTITLGGGGGTLTDGVGFSGLTGAGAGVYTLSGTAAAITSELDALIFTPVAGAPNTSSKTLFTLSDQSSAGGAPVVDSTTSVIDSDPAVAPTIAGTISGQTTTSESPIKPFAHVTIGDANVGANDTLTITLSGAGGALSGTGLSGGVGGVYTLSGAAAAITRELDALIFMPVAGAPNTSSTTTFTLSDQSTAGGAPVVDATTTVIDKTVGTPPPPLSVEDTTLNQAPAPSIQTYTGPVTGIQHQYINVGTDCLNIDATTPNWFIHSGSGNDAIAVSSGTNVLDGGAGSNFLTGGSGADTFFVDDRGHTGDIWSTVNNFHAGDAATIWGITQQDYTLDWADGQGAAGYTGLTLHAMAPGVPTASLTLVGFATSDLKDGRLSVSFGSSNGSSYMYVHENS